MPGCSIIVKPDKGRSELGWAQAEMRHRERLQTLKYRLFGAVHACLNRREREVSEAGRIDPAFYIETYPEVKENGCTPPMHYISHGWKKGMKPNRIFDPAFYLHENPDVQEAGFEPLLHYITHGWREGRRPNAQFAFRKKDSNKKTVRAKWDLAYSKHKQEFNHWWESPYIIRHINRKFDDCPTDIHSGGIISRMRKLAGGRLPLGRGVSVGCGTAYKELYLLEENIVQDMQLYELSGVAVKNGENLLAGRGFKHRAKYVLGDAFELVREQECFDLVFWNNSLHHMMDVEKALEWSYRVLRPGGILVMDDYVGPSRFQWSDRMLQIGTTVRKALPERYLEMQTQGNRNIINGLFKRLFGKPELYPKNIYRPSVESVIADDPS